MRKKNSNYCALPFVHLALEGNGDVKGCCLTPSFKDENGNSFNLNKKNLDDILQCEDYLSFKRSFDENKRHEYCNTCWMMEEQGLTSNREKFTKDYGYLDEGLGVEKVSFIEIKAGNNCNLACGICSPINSSLWAKNESNFLNDDFSMAYNKHAKWVEQKNLWASAIIDGARTFHLMGGEPFLIKQNEDLIDYLIEKSDPSNITIWYNTNGTIYPPHLMKKLKAFKRVEIAFSVDHYGEKFEFQRAPAKWEKVHQNLVRFYENRDDNFHYTIDVCWSIFNACDIVSIIHFFEHFFDTYDLREERTQMSSCRHFYSGAKYSLNNLLVDEKRIFRSKLENAFNELNDHYKSLLEELISWLDSPVTLENAWEIRSENIKILERIQHMKFSTYYPSLSKVLNH